MKEMLCDVNLLMQNIMILRELVYGPAHSEGF